MYLSYKSYDYFYKRTEFLIFVLRNQIVNAIYMKISNIRLLNQQLLNPLFSNPKELVSWMGAMQAQNYPLVKWAVLSGDSS